MVELVDTPDLGSGTARCGSSSLSRRTIKEVTMKQLWILWAKALGEKASDDKLIADKIATIRTMIVLSYLITNMFIIAGVIRHW